MRRRESRERTDKCRPRRKRKIIGSRSGHQVGVCGKGEQSIMSCTYKKALPKYIILYANNRGYENSLADSQTQAGIQRVSSMKPTLAIHTLSHAGEREREKKKNPTTSVDTVPTGDGHTGLLHTQQKMKEEGKATEG